jgi:hypothetical protein
MRNQWILSGKADLAAAPAAPMFLYICASIAEYGHLDEVAESDATVQAGLEKICPGVSHLRSRNIVTSCPSALIVVTDIWIAVLLRLHV